MPTKNDEPEITQAGLLIEYFQNNPQKSISHPEVVDWSVAEYKKRTGKTFRDPDRGIRKLHQDGYLKKKGKEYTATSQALHIKGILKISPQR